MDEKRAQILIDKLTLAEEKGIPFERAKEILLKYGYTEEEINQVTVEEGVEEPLDDAQQDEGPKKRGYPYILVLAIGSAIGIFVLIAGLSVFIIVGYFAVAVAAWLALFVKNRR